MAEELLLWWREGQIKFLNKLYDYFKKIEGAFESPDTCSYESSWVWIIVGKFSSVQTDEPEATIDKLLPKAIDEDNRRLSRTC